MPTNPDLLIVGGILTVITFFWLSREFLDVHREKKKWSKSHLYAASPRKFEEIVKEYYIQVYEGGSDDIELTEASGDRGLDVVISPTPSLRQYVSAELTMSPIWAEKTGIECKRYTPGNRVGPATVQQTHGAAKERNCENAVVITSTGFTENAIDSAAALDVELIDGDELASKLSKVTVSPDQWNIGNT